MEVYVEDMIAKSKNEEDHHIDLQKIFELWRNYDLKLNRNKYVFGATSGKLLGYIVSERGIESDPSKIKAITECHHQEPKKES